MELIYIVMLWLGFLTPETEIYSPFFHNVYQHNVVPIHNFIDTTPEDVLQTIYKGYDRETEV